MTRKTGFSIKALDTYEWPVDVQVPCINAEGDGDFETHRFTGKFKHLSLSEAKTVSERLKKAVKQEQDRMREQGETDVADPTTAMKLAERVADALTDKQ